jgi:hypothetical protein
MVVGQLFWKSNSCFRKFCTFNFSKLWLWLLWLCLWRGENKVNSLFCLLMTWMGVWQQMLPWHHTHNLKESIKWNVLYLLKIRMGGKWSTWRVNTLPFGSSCEGGGGYPGVIGLRQSILTRHFYHQIYRYISTLFMWNLTLH